MKTIYLLFLMLLSISGAYSQCNAKASFTYKDSSGFLIFTNTSVNCNQWEWHIDGYNYSFTKHLTIYKPLSGVVRARLVVRDLNSSNCIDSSLLMFINFGACVTKADFIGTANSMTATFVDYSVCNRMKQFWDYGDGTTSNQFQANHTYGSVGTYNVKLIISDSMINGCLDSFEMMIQLKNCYVKADFDAKLDSNGGGFWRFINKSLNAKSYEWDFGDSSSFSYLKNPTHMYRYSSNYVVRLIARDSSSNSCADTLSLSIPDDVCSPIAKYTFTKSNRTVTFNNLSVLANKWEWTFGDGNQSSAKNPVHTYAKHGTYYVYLKAYDSTKQNCYKYYSLVVVVDTCAAKASFFFKDSAKSVTFFNTSYNVNKVLWVFGDGDSSTVISPTHVYNSATKYIATLYVYDTNYNGCFSSYTDSFTLKSCKAYFEIRPDTTQQFSGVLLDKSTCRNSATYLWDFGDSTTSTSKTPTHIYSGKGPFYIKLCITDSNCSSCYTRLIKYDSMGNLNMALRPFSFRVEREGSKSSSTKISYLESIVLAPNPVQNVLKIKHNEEQLIDVQLYSLNGVLLFEQKDVLEELVIDFENYNSGIFMMKIQSKDGDFKVYKIIKN
jgi:PKD repeat protein